jgi:hypothetical protein
VDKGSKTRKIKKGVTVASCQCREGKRGRVWVRLGEKPGRWSRGAAAEGDPAAGGGGRCTVCARQGS